MRRMLMSQLPALWPSRARLQGLRRSVPENHSGFASEAFSRMKWKRG